jgi:hypothetical protein
MPVLRIAAALLCVPLLAVQTLARDRSGCREEVIAAFRRLHTSGPFAFAAKFRGPNSGEMPGAVDGHGSLLLGAQDKEGTRIYIGPLRWNYRGGQWSRGGTWGGTSSEALMLYGAMLGFNLAQIEKGLDAATCTKEIATRDGKEEITYAYRVSKWIITPFEDHEKLRVDAATGHPLHLQMKGHPPPKERDKPPGPLRELTFRVDASIKIEPPAPPDRDSLEGTGRQR